MTHWLTETHMSTQTATHKTHIHTHTHPRMHAWAHTHTHTHTSLLANSNTSFLQQPEHSGLEKAGLEGAYAAD